jgi:hypothetical protein
MASVPLHEFNNADFGKFIERHKVRRLLELRRASFDSWFRQMPSQMFDRPTGVHTLRHKPMEVGRRTRFLSPLKRRS